MDTTGPTGTAVLAGASLTSASTPATSTASASATTVTSSAAVVTSSPAAVIAPVVPASPSADVTVYSPVLDSVAVLSPSIVATTSPSAVVTPVSPLPGTPSGYVAPYTVVNYGQCGGNKVYCDQVKDCVDAVWSGASCNPGFQCNRYDATWWQCQPTSRRLLRLR